MCSRRWRYLGSSEVCRVPTHGAASRNKTECGSRARCPRTAADPSEDSPCAVTRFDGWLAYSLYRNIRRNDKQIGRRAPATFKDTATGQGVGVRTRIGSASFTCRADSLHLVVHHEAIGGTCAVSWRCPGGTGGLGRTLQRKPTTRNSSRTGYAIRAPGPERP